jgi:hypothetical protein
MKSWPLLVACACGPQVSASGGSTSSGAASSESMTTLLDPSAVDDDGTVVDESGEDHPAQVCRAWYEPGMAPPGLERVGVCGDL